MGHSLTPGLTMADIFISYASADRKRVEPLVDLLKQQGWSVWWDRDLIAGPSFDREIEKALHKARCVLVVWSRNSIDSTWCRAEATDAQEREILVPVVIDDVRPPLAFRSAQTASMVGWPRSQDNLERVFDGISACLGTPKQASLKASQGKKKSPWLVAAITAGALLIAIALWVVVDTQPPADDPVSVNHDVVRIAVLPFEDFSTNGDNAHIAAGFQADIISMLAEVDELEVTSRGSTQRFSQTSERSMAEIARELSVSHVLEGSIRRSADQVRISIQLINTNTDSQIWAESYDRKMNNIFAIQTEVAQDVASQLQKNFSNQEPNTLAHQPTDDLQAYELVLKGREQLEVGTAKSLAQAAVFMRQAVARDPGLAEAHSGLSRALFLQSFLNTTWSEVRTEALQASETALQLDPDSASIHTNYAHIRGVWEGDTKTARTHYQRAIELEPNNSFSLLQYGAHLTGAGETEKGLPFLERAMTLDPLSGEISFYLAKALAFSGKTEEASEILEHGIKFNPNHIDLRVFEVDSLTFTGDLTTAFTRLQELVVLAPQHFQVQLQVMLLLSTIGELEAAQVWVDRMQTLSPTHEDYFDAQRFIYAATGNFEGLNQLVGRWQTLNSIDRSSRDASSTLSFTTLCQLQILALRADDARRSNDRETEKVLRHSAIQIAEETLTDEKGNLALSWWDQQIAVPHAVHQRLVGQEQQSSALLNILLQSAPPPEFSPIAMQAHALLGDSASSVDFFRSRVNQPNDQTAMINIRDNQFGLYDSILANPELVKIIDGAIAANKTLQAYVRTELPTLLTATTGL